MQYGPLSLCSHFLKRILQKADISYYCTLGQQCLHKSVWVNPILNANTPVRKWNYNLYLNTEDYSFLIGFHTESLPTRCWAHRAFAVYLQLFYYPTSQTVWMCRSVIKSEPLRAARINLCIIYYIWKGMHVLVKI